MGFIIGLLLFSIPATIIAVKKGFAPLRWMLSLGIIGLGIVLYLPGGRAAGITPEEAQKRVNRANMFGARLAWVNFGLNIISLTVSLWNLIENDIWEPAAIPVLLFGIAYCASERIIAFRWLVADTEGGQKPFSLWAFLVLVFPLLGVGLYLIFKPKDQSVVSWHFPEKTALSLAAVAALIMAAPSSSIGYFHHASALSITYTVLTIKILFAIMIGVSSWYISKTKTGKWQNSPFFLLFGLLLSISTIFYHFTGLSESYAGFILYVLIVSVSIACVISALIQLAQFDIGDVGRGLLLGYAGAWGISFALGNMFGAYLSAAAVILFTALPLAYMAFLSSKEALVEAQPDNKRPSFLMIASPFWAFLIVQLLVSWGLSR